MPIEAEGLGFLIAAASIATPFVLVGLVRKPMGRPPIDDTPEAALQSERRREIVKHVRENPGVKVNDLKRALKLGGGTVNLHVDKLLRSGVLESRDAWGTVRLYVSGSAPGENDPSLMSEATKRVAMRLVKKPGRSSLQIAGAMQIAQENVRVHLQRLREAGLVWVEESGREHLYHPTDALIKAVEQWNAED